MPAPALAAPVPAGRAVWLGLPTTAFDWLGPALAVVGIQPGAMPPAPLPA